MDHGDLQALGEKIAGQLQSWSHCVEPITGIATGVYAMMTVVTVPDLVDMPLLSSVFALFYFKGLSYPLLPHITLFFILSKMFCQL
jgi:hypothetical protein